jgi:hypothetical protein
MSADPHALSQGAYDQIEVNQAWQPDAPPDILERYRKNIVAVQNVPSDRVTFASYVVTEGSPQQIVGRQPEGIASRVSVRVAFIDPVGGVPVVTNDKSSIPTNVYDFGASLQLAPACYILPHTLSSTVLTAQEVTFHTRDELWAAYLLPSGSGGTGMVVSVYQELYDIG